MKRFLCFWHGHDFSLWRRGVHVEWRFCNRCGKRQIVDPKSDRVITDG